MEVAGSYSINGWLYYYDTKPDGVSTWIQDVPKFFQKDAAVTRPALTPFFMDAIWPDTWPTAADLPPTDLYLGNVNSSLGRICIARHPLQRQLKATNAKPAAGRHHHELRRRPRRQTAVATDQKPLLAQRLCADRGYLAHDAVAASANLVV